MNRKCKKNYIKGKMLTLNVKILTLRAATHPPSGWALNTNF